jgi:hypothetical protein
LKNLNKKLSGKRSRLAASEVMGSILLMGVTLAVGFAVWAWASNAALSSERNFGNSIAVNTNCLNLGLTVINANFNSSAAYAKLVTLWVYNNGHGNENISNIQISNVSSGGNWVFVYGFQQSKTNTTGRVTWFGFAGNGSTPAVPIKSITINVNTFLTPNRLYNFQAQAKNETWTATGPNKGFWSYQCSTTSSAYQQVTPNTSPV